MTNHVYYVCQLECLRCGHTWYSSRDDAAALTIEGPSNNIVGTAPMATAKFDDLERNLVSPRDKGGATDKGASDMIKKTADKGDDLMKKTTDKGGENDLIKKTTDKGGANDINKTGDKGDDMIRQTTERGGENDLIKKTSDKGGADDVIKKTTEAFIPVLDNQRSFNKIKAEENSPTTTKAQ